MSKGQNRRTTGRTTPLRATSIAVRGNPEALEKARVEFQRSADQWCQELGIAPTKVMLEDDLNKENGTNREEQDVAAHSVSENNGAKAKAKASNRRVHASAAAPPAAEKPTSTSSTRTPSTPVTASISEEAAVFCIPSTFADHFKLNDFGALLAARITSGCSSIVLNEPGEKTFSTIRIRAVGTAQAISLAQQNLQRIVSQVCRDRSIEDVAIHAEREDKYEAKLARAVKGLRVALQSLRNPVAVLTTGPRSESGVKSDTQTSTGESRFANCHGVTISSLSAVALSPYPIISFNLAANSRTYAALQLREEFKLHFLSATPLGAKIAEAFTKPYEHSYTPFEELGEGVTIDYYPPKFTVPRLGGRGILRVLRGTMRPNLKPREDFIPLPKPVRFGDKVVVFARISFVEPSKWVKEEDHHVEFDGQEALGYAAGKFRGFGGIITPGVGKGGDVENPVPTDTGSWQAQEGKVEAKEAEKQPELDCDSDDFLGVVEDQLAGAGERQEHVVKHGEFGKAEQQDASVEDVATSSLAVQAQEGLGSGGQIVASESDSQSQALHASSIEQLNDSVAEENPSEQDWVDLASLDQQLDLRPGEATQQSALSTEKSIPSERAAGKRSLNFNTLPEHVSAPTQSFDEALRPAPSETVRPARMPSAPMFTIPSRPTPKSNQAHFGLDPESTPQRSFSTSAQRLFLDRLRPRAPEPSNTEPDVKHQTVAEFFGPTLHSRPPPRTRHIFNSRRIIDESSAAIEELAALHPTTPTESEEINQQVTSLQEKIAIHTRRITRTLAKNSAIDLRAMLDTGALNHRLIEYMERQVGEGLNVAKEDAEQGAGRLHGFGGRAGAASAGCRGRN
ncbi:hypothetical protein MBLNU230_g1375t2 [Neophaeotheca triangularis]